MRPLSVVTRTTICLRVAPDHADAGERGLSGMASGMAWIEAIFMSLGSVVERFGGSRVSDADGVHDLRAHAIEEALPVVDAVDPAIEPGAVAVDRPALIVIPREELVMAAIVSLDGGR